MKTALLIVDIQNDYFPKGKMELEGSTEASLRAKELLELFRAEKLPVFFVQHISAQKGAAFFLPDTEGALIHENVRPLPGETVIRKHYPNSFRETGLLDHLKKEQVGRLLVCGMMTSMCIDATVRAAFDYGFQCLVAHDACATRSHQFKEITIPATHVHGAFLAALGSVYARVMSTKDTIEKRIYRSS
ncbi:MAG TPA: cysteine hydrolase family protein [Syntrophales bacterium]|nr:cysteine hydrolase family protein [Syntrophales bacterium]HOX95560.1 cysteine hydrolase family protein [Syntrophales bacterium]HPI57463.1 cysteine hydrolase family protein [Syntrophales bacterium]HPN25680.1 cysteine hydrolase family protein [Syntrophales bacterium]HQM29488.1 cysteine hydrolase family protein [Syntrophales bacterium]